MRIDLFNSINIERFKKNVLVLKFYQLLGTSGDKGNNWNEKTFDYSLGINHRIVFEVIKTTVVRASDIAIDDVDVAIGFNCRGNVKVFWLTSILGVHFKQLSMCLPAGATIVKIPSSNEGVIWDHKLCDEKFLLTANYIWIAKYQVES